MPFPEKISCPPRRNTFKELHSSGVAHWNSSRSLLLLVGDDESNCQIAYKITLAMLVPFQALDGISLVNGLLFFLSFSSNFR
jgi:hypothetical protein